ncbi:PA14 domain-containing protein [Planctomyces sp. SH-PL14]|uniref:PA14 domain-containing protein n=1 Tax=Planctomyces sp. SH-PL14 TaxID=1632864 RepID=UPI00078E61F4|nr:PA14 domain-containing protein [Planctomyces sp. SH-PL14]AMV16315.1 PA14 domain protein [Planctomyces sp. SH-PL14]
MRSVRGILNAAVGLVCLAFAALASGDDEKPLVNGLKAEIYAGRNFEQKIAEQVDPNIEHYWDHGAPHESAPIDDFSVRWSGWLRPPAKGRYKFLVQANDGVRLWIGGQKIIDDWRAKSDLREASIELEDVPVPIQMELFEGPATAWAVLMWQPTGAPTAAAIPTDAFFLDEEAAKGKPQRIGADKRGLVAEYFDRKFARKFGTGRVSGTEAMWGDRGAAAVGLKTQGAARYTGVLVPPVTGQYKLIAWADDRAQVWIDGKPVIEGSYEHKKADTAFIDLEAGVPYAIRIDFVNSIAWGGYYLHWIPPKGDRELRIPAECLFQSKGAIPKR